QDKQVNARCSCGYHTRNVLVRYNCSFKDSIIATRSTHAQHVPGVLDSAALGVARHKGMDDFRRLWVAGIHAMDAEICPHWRQAAKRFVPRKAIPARNALGLGGGV